MQLRVCVLSVRVEQKTSRAYSWHEIGRWMSCLFCLFFFASRDRWLIRWQVSRFGHLGLRDKNIFLWKWVQLLKGILIKIENGMRKWKTNGGKCAKVCEVARWWMMQSMALFRAESGCFVGGLASLDVIRYRFTGSKWIRLTHDGVCWLVARCTAKPRALTCRIWAAICPDNCVRRASRQSVSICCGPMMKW